MLTVNVSKVKNHNFLGYISVDETDELFVDLAKRLNVELSSEIEIGGEFEVVVDEQSVTVNVVHVVAFGNGKIIEVDPSLVDYENIAEQINSGSRNADLFAEFFYA